VTCPIAIIQGAKPTKTRHPQPAEPVAQGCNAIKAGQALCCGAAQRRYYAIGGVAAGRLGLHIARTGLD
jgi:hypothetical protein